MPVFGCWIAGTVGIGGWIDRVRSRLRLVGAACAGISGLTARVDVVSIGESRRQTD